ncbi:MAG: cation:proton antiporter subunit C [Candidatus Saganbacteria bacterium]|nr:cation:proton antiporter subunit C [Candidatus Saganbacteria bacterium]
MIEINGLTIGIIIILIGAYGILTKRNLIKMTMALYVMNSGAILFFVSLGFRKNSSAAILGDWAGLVVDPLPQAVVLTSIVIGLGITSLALALAIKIYEEYKTLDTSNLKEK